MNNELKYFLPFSTLHFQTLIVCIVAVFILLYIPKFFKFKDKKSYDTYGKFLGFLMISFKIFDSTYRVLYQREPIQNTFIINLCNFVLLFGGFYLITKSKTLFNLTYFLSFGAFFALILPGIGYYYYPSYAYVFMFAHILEFVAVIYGFIYFKEKITKRGLIRSCIILTIIFIYAYFYNMIFKSTNPNAMYLDDYISSLVSFVKPIWLYRISYYITMILFVNAMYLPFKNKK